MEIKKKHSLLILLVLTISILPLINAQTIQDTTLNAVGINANLTFSVSTYFTYLDLDDNYIYLTNVNYTIGRDIYRCSSINLTTPNTQKDITQVGCELYTKTNQICENGQISMGDSIGLIFLILTIGFIGFILSLVFLAFNGIIDLGSIDISNITPEFLMRVVMIVGFTALLLVTMVFVLGAAYC